MLHREYELRQFLPSNRFVLTPMRTGRRIPGGRICSLVGGRGPTTRFLVYWQVVLADLKSTGLQGFNAHIALGVLEGHVQQLCALDAEPGQMNTVSLLLLSCARIKISGLLQ